MGQMGNKIRPMAFTEILPALQTYRTIAGVYPSARQLAVYMQLRDHHASVRHWRILRRAGLIAQNERGHIIWAFGERAPHGDGNRAEHHDARVRGAMPEAAVTEIQAVIDSAIAGIPTDDAASHGARQATYQPLSAQDVKVVQRIARVIKQEIVARDDELRATPEFKRDAALIDAMRDSVMDIATQQGALRLLRLAYARLRLIQTTKAPPVRPSSRRPKPASRDT